MPCRALSAFVLTVGVAIAAAPAHATPRPLTRGFGEEMAPAGEQVLVTRTDGANLRVLAIPVTGGVAREVFSFDVPDGLYLERAELAASPQRAALALTMVKSFRDNIRAVRAFAGPVEGGWSELWPFTELGPDFPFSVQVDGERIFTRESRGGLDDESHVVVRDTEPHEVAFASADEAESATFAGDFVAYRSGPSDHRDLGDVLVVRDWRTGAVLSSARPAGGRRLDRPAPRWPRRREHRLQRHAVRAAPGRAAAAAHPARRPAGLRG